MKKILITGAKGFLGSRTAVFYNGRYMVLTPGHAEFDFTETEQTRRFFDLEKPDIVIHCGAVSDVGSCERDPEMSYRVNVTGAENMAKACNEFSAKMIFCSSDQIYFDKKISSEPHTEQDTAAPQNEYGKQKLLAEERCLSIAADTVCLRLTWMYDYVNGQTGEHQDLFRNLISAITEKRELSFPVNDIRGITFVRYVVQNFEKAFLLPGGVYNFGSQNDRNTYETMYEMIYLYKPDYLSMLKSNQQAFSDIPRNININNTKIAQHGIIFPDTISGLMDCAKQYRRYQNNAV